MELETKTILYTDENEMRIDLFLTKQLTTYTRSHLQKIITAGLVKVNGKEVKANYKLKVSDQIEIKIENAQPVEILAEKIPLHVLYEDKDVIVINKTRGMVVHPAPGNESGTLVNALLAHCSDLSGINGELRPGIVHRLDKDTSGVMVAAKNDFSHVSLAQQIKDKTAQRKYLAIVHGNIKENTGEISGAIGRHKTDRKKMAVVKAGGKPATTNFKVIERFGSFTFVECILQTGRTHQIRVHMTYIGYPLVGDPKYGGLRSPFQIRGQALHSSSLRFLHPVTNQEMEFFAPLPEDMEKILRYLRNKQR